MVWFGKREKLASRYIEPFEILEMVDTVAYRLALLSSLSSVHKVFHIFMFWKCTPDSAHVMDWREIIVDTNGTFEEGSVRIMDSQDQVLRRKTMRLAKVLWQHRGVDEATWEREDTMRVTYPFLFEDEGAWSNIGTRITIAYACVLCVLVCVNFGDEILLRGEECKTRKKLSFF